jgi:uncharacterized membrane protein
LGFYERGAFKKEKKNMLTVVLAILSGFFFACHSLVIRMGLEDSNTLPATLVSSIVNAALLVALSLIFLPLKMFFNKGLLFLCVAGLFAPCLARLCLYTGIDRAGIAVTLSIEGTYPIFSALAAIMILHESLTAGIAVATILTIFGVIFISTGPKELSRQLSIKRQWRKVDLAFPLCAAALYGVSRVFRKMGVLTVTSPLGSSAVIALVSLAFYVFLIPYIKGDRPIRISRRGIWYFSLGGVFASLGQIFIMAALKIGQVIVVAPLSNTTPFFGIILAHIFLKKAEIVTTRVVLAAAAIFLGVTVLAFYA